MLPHMNRPSSADIALVVSMLAGVLVTASGLATAVPQSSSAVGINVTFLALVHSTVLSTVRMVRIAGSTWWIYLVAGTFVSLAALFAGWYGALVITDSVFSSTVVLLIAGLLHSAIYSLSRCVVSDRTAVPKP